MGVTLCPPAERSGVDHAEYGDDAFMQMRDGGGWWYTDAHGSGEWAMQVSAPLNSKAAENHARAERMKAEREEHVRRAMAEGRKKAPRKTRKTMSASAKAAKRKADADKIGAAREGAPPKSLAKFIDLMEKGTASG